MDAADLVHEYFIHGTISPDPRDLLITIPVSLFSEDKYMNSLACFPPVERNDTSALNRVLRKVFLSQLTESDLYQCFIALLYDDTHTPQW